MEAALTTARRTSFMRRRLHSLSGVVPLGAFLVEHIWTNAAALGGRAPFTRAARAIQEIPALWVLEVAFIFVPLVYHASYGMIVASRGRFNASRYPYGTNWLYILQRVSGGLVLVFVSLHLWEFRIQKLFFGLSVDGLYDRMAGHFSWTWFGVPWIALGYLLGILASVFHFSNGLVTSCVTWGMVGSQRALRRISAAVALFGTALFFLGASTVIGVATGRNVLGASPPNANARYKSCGSSEAAPAAP